MLGPERQKQIADYIQVNSSATVKTLGELFDVSPSTVRRDLEILEERDLVRRVRGGAVAVSSGDEPPILQRARRRADEKRRIGEAAAHLVSDGETILITGGTTTAAMVPFLTERQDLTVITNSVGCVQQLAHYPNITVVVLGGWLRHSELSHLGHFTECVLKELRPHRVFHGIYGLSAQDGLTGSDFQEVRTDRSLISAAPELVVMADHTKFAQRGVVQLAPMTAAAIVVTDTGAPESEVEALRDLGIEVILA